MFILELVNPSLIFAASSLSIRLLTFLDYLLTLRLILMYHPPTNLQMEIQMERLSWKLDLPKTNNTEESDRHYISQASLKSESSSSAKSLGLRCNNISSKWL